MQELDRGFVSWVEGEFRARGVKVETMFLSPRLPLDAVIRRQILEGVHAVSQLDMRSQNSSKIPLQVFDRQGGANNVRFDEYRDLDPRIAQSWSFVQSRRNLKFLPLTLNHNIHLINPTNLLLLPPLPQPTQLQISLHWWASWTTTLYRGY